MDLSQKNIKRLQKYAKLVIEKGIALKNDMCVDIRVEPEQYEAARVFAVECYKLGAKFVNIEIRDYTLQAERTNIQNKNQLSFYPKFMTCYDRERTDDGWGLISIDTTESEDALKNADSEKNTYFTQNWRKNGKYLHDATLNHQIPWCVICIPGPAWAKKVFGKEGKCEELWDRVASILHLDDKDPSLTWQKIAENMLERRKTFGDLKIKTLHYKSPKTDFEVSFLDKAIWKGGAQKLPDGRLFIPNLPTYEIYSAPDCLTATGKIATTRPVNVLSGTVEDAVLTFKNGSVVDFSAKKGAKELEQYLNIDPGCKTIGEVALVDEDSPIAKSGLVYTSILYDENASCHIALGASYPDCVKGGENAKTPEDLKKLHLSDSLMHTDFMVGSPDMNITAITYDNKTVQIMKNGRFTL